MSPLGATGHLGLERPAHPPNLTRLPHRLLSLDVFDVDKADRLITNLGLPD